MPKRSLKPAALAAKFETTDDAAAANHKTADDAPSSRQVGACNVFGVKLCWIFAALQASKKPAALKKPRVLSQELGSLPRVAAEAFEASDTLHAAQDASLIVQSAASLTMNLRKRKARRPVDIAEDAAGADSLSFVSQLEAPRNSFESLGARQAVPFFGSFARLLLVVFCKCRRCCL